jgi:hypothetical protein
MVNTVIYNKMEHKAPQQGDKQLQTKNSEDAGARM